MSKVHTKATMQTFLKLRRTEQLIASQEHATTITSQALGISVRLISKSWSRPNNVVPCAELSEKARSISATSNCTIRCTETIRQGNNELKVTKEESVRLDTVLRATALTIILTNHLPAPSLLIANSATISRELRAFKITCKRLQTYSD